LQRGRSTPRSSAPPHRLHPICSSVVSTFLGAHGPFPSDGAGLSALDGYLRRCTSATSRPRSEQALCFKPLREFDGPHGHACRLSPKNSRSLHEGRSRFRRSLAAKSARWLYCFSRLPSLIAALAGRSALWPDEALGRADASQELGLGGITGLLASCRPKARKNLGGRSA